MPVVLLQPMSVIILLPLLVQHVQQLILIHNASVISASAPPTPALLVVLIVALFQMAVLHLAELTAEGVILVVPVSAMSANINAPA